MQMAQMGFGLSRETVMCLTFKIVDANKSILLEIKRQVIDGLMASIADILSYLYVHLYLYLIVVHGVKCGYYK